LLTPGTLIVADGSRPDAGALTDVAALLRRAANGFFVAALWGLARTAASPWPGLRSRLGVTSTGKPTSCKLKSAGSASAWPAT
jgi:hypothetical protein